MTVRATCAGETDTRRTSRYGSSHGEALRDDRRRPGRAIGNKKCREWADRRTRDQPRVNIRHGEPQCLGDGPKRLERVTEVAVLGIGELGRGRTHPVRSRVMDDDGRVADRVVPLIVKQRRDSDRHRRKQDDDGGEWRETSAPEGASHPKQNTLRRAKLAGPTFSVLGPT